MTKAQLNPGKDRIARLYGQLPDWKFLAIEECGASLHDLEVALAWANDEDDVMGEARIPLVGKARQVYDILLADRDDEQ